MAVIDPYAHPDEDKFVARHPYLMDGSNRALGFFEVLAEDCPDCNGRNKLGIVTRTHDSETVHCTGCDYQLTRRPAPRVQPMNSRRRPEE